ncbi:MAG: UvrY/SirA/GacA family response regulator transcription factor [Thioalkalispiraceae bacterium]|jgi:DNA-binding NarL/FixJ family response regulator
MIKVLLVDDHDLVRTGIKRLLDDIDDIDVVGEATCGEDALKLAVQHSLDVILMDINMPGMGGLEATRKLQSSNPDMKIIIVTMHEDDLFAQRLLKAGATGYLTKGAGVDEIVHAIREVNMNRRYISPDIAQQLALAQFPDHEGSPFDSLSERELQVMMLLMDGMKVNEISDKLCLSPKTISTYRHRLYDKLNVQNDIELTRLAMVHGVIENNIPV